MKRAKSERAILAGYDSNGLFCAITFRDGKRLGTYGGLDSIELAKHVSDQGKRGLTVLVVQDGVLSTLESIIDDLDKLQALLKVKAK
jgi:hypothetical protein